MVGVGGRSKACENCYRRRIKCDETHPECNRCIKADLKCGGPRSTAFIQYKSRSDQKVSISLPKRSEGTSSPVKKDATATRRTDKSNSGSLMGALSGFKLRPPEDSIFECYTRAHFMQGQNQEPLIFVGFNRRLSGKCFLALATTYFGAEHRQQALVSRGLQRYGRSLKELNMALSDSKKCLTYDVLESVFVMTLFGFFNAKNQNGWISHARGLEKLVHLRGPESFTKVPDLVILESTRPAMVTAALVLNQPTIFSKKEWKTVPWSLHPQRKTRLHELIEIMADCADIYVMRANLNESLLERYGRQGYDALMDRVQNILDDLDEWKRSWDEKYPDCSTEKPTQRPTPVIVDASGYSRPAWTTALHFPDLFHSSGVGLYNATLILLHLFHLDLLRVGNPDSSELAKIQKCLFTAGITICRTIEYHLEGPRDGAGSLYLLYPIRMAFAAVGLSNPSIAMWLQDILTEIQHGSAGRWQTAEYLLEISVR